MKENKLAELSMAFSVDIINLVKHLRQHRIIADEDRHRTVAEQKSHSTSAYPL